MFGNIPLDTKDYEGDVNVGDLVEIKPGMMLMEPIDPVMVLEADNEKGFYKIMYLRNNYVVGCGRMDIKQVVSHV